MCTGVDYRGSCRTPCPCIACHALQALDDVDEDAYQTSFIDRYVSRPPELEDMCLAEFAANYSTMSGNKEEELSDALPSDEPEDNQPPASQRIKLNRLGNMYKLMQEI